MRLRTFRSWKNLTYKNLETMGICHHGNCSDKLDWCLYSNSFMFLPHIIKSGKKRNHGYVDIRKWNGEGIPYWIFLRNLQHNFEVQRPTLIVKFVHTTQSLRSKATIYLFIYLSGWKTIKRWQSCLKMEYSLLLLFGKNIALKAQKFVFWVEGVDTFVLTGYSSKSSLK